MTTQQKSSTSSRLSIKVDDFQEGGALPVQQNLLVQEARVVVWDYDKRVKDRNGNIAITTAAKLTLRDEANNDHIQYYSAGDPARIGPSDDARGFVAKQPGTSLVKGSNFHTLVVSMVNAGYPANRLSDDVAVSLEGLYAYWDAVPQPRRTGLNSSRSEDSRPQVLIVPQKILRLPWEQAVQPVPLTATVVPTAMPTTDMASSLIPLVLEMLAGSGPHNRSQLATLVFTRHGSNPLRDRMMQHVFSPEFAAILPTIGHQLVGEEIR